MLYGIGAALGFGVADLFGAVSTRRIGVPVTLFVIQVVDVAALSVLLLTPLPGALEAEGAAWVAIFAGGALGTISFFCFYRALQLGPVAVVSPVFASYASISVILSVILIGERLSPLATLGVVGTLVGVVLATVGTAAAETPVRSSSGGIPYALAATLAWGIATYLIGRYAQQTGWFLPVYGSRVVEFVGVGAALVLLRAIGRPIRVPRPQDAAIAAGAGLADVTAVALFARGSQVGLVSIVSAVSATFPLVLITAGVTLFRERPTLAQWVGALTTVAGLVVLALGR
jgi:bacterial/archaeal transporter family protein